MDPSLQVHRFQPFTEKQPINTHYQSYTADSSTEQSINWNVDSPFAGALLDNEVYIEYKIRINTDADGAALANEELRGMFGGRPTIPGNIVGAQHVGANLPDGASAGSPSLANSKFALRQGWSVHGALSSCDVTINGQSLRQSSSSLII